MAPAGVLGMDKAQLPVCRGSDLHARFGEVARFIRLDRKAQRLSVDDDETVAAIGDVDFERAKAVNFERRIEFVSKGRHVADMNPLRLAVAAIGDNRDDAPRRFQRQMRLRLLHRQNAAVEQHRGDTDRVGARHRRRVFGLHDDEAHAGPRVLGWDEQVDMTEHAAARLVEHEGAQGAVACDKARLLPERFAERRRNAADNDVADFAFGMAGDDVDGFCRSHGGPR